MAGLGSQPLILIASKEKIFLLSFSKCQGDYGLFAHASWFCKKIVGWLRHIYTDILPMTLVFGTRHASFILKLTLSAYVAITHVVEYTKEALSAGHRHYMLGQCWPSANCIFLFLHILQRLLGLINSQNL